MQGTKIELKSARNERLFPDNLGFNIAVWKRPRHVAPIDPIKNAFVFATILPQHKPLIEGFEHGPFNPRLYDFDIRGLRRRANTQPNPGPAGALVTGHQRGDQEGVGNDGDHGWWKKRDGSRENRS